MCSTTMLSLLSLAALTVASPHHDTSLLLGRTSCSTPDGSGSCHSTSSCTGFSIAGYCPGATDIQCCIQDTSCTTSKGSGTCMNANGNHCSSSGGAFVGEPVCPGPDDVQCCVSGAGSSSSPSSSSASAPPPTPSASSGSSSSSSGGGGDGHVNQATLGLVEQLEGFRADFYQIDGDTTVGYGHDCTQLQDCGSLHTPLSQAEGESLLKKDIQSYESCVCNLPNASGLNANQFGALVSFTYNSGCGGVQKYFESDMSNKAYSTICSALPDTNTLSGELSSRRAKEGQLCSEDTSTKSGC